jgi:hypothetical protein
VLAQHAVHEDGLVNWPGQPVVRSRVLETDGSVSSGAPALRASSPAAGSISTRNCCSPGAELIWRAGAHSDEKGHGLCHGTSGNGFALLKAFARTGDELWLERARRFALHALTQADRIATANGRRRYSLFNGDVGTALFAAASLDREAGVPVIDYM